MRIRNTTIHKLFIADGEALLPKEVGECDDKVGQLFVDRGQAEVYADEPKVSKRSTKNATKAKA